MESFRFEDKNEILSVLSSARAWTSVILAGNRDSRRHSTAGLNENLGWFSNRTALYLNSDVEQVVEDQLRGLKWSPPLPL